MHYGNELIVNGDFHTDSGWTKGTGWTISGGCAVFTNASGSLSQDFGIEAGKTYRIMWTICALNGLGVYVKIGSAQGPGRTAVGTYEDIITAADTDPLKFWPSLGDSGKIDSVSCREVNPWYKRKRRRRRSFMASLRDLLKLTFWSEDI
jgi:hypothetical protein